MAAVDNEEKKEVEQDDVHSLKEILPSNVQPTHYFLSYKKLDMVKEFKFDGVVKIDLEVFEDDVAQIIINSGEITYSSIKVSQGDSTSEIDVSTISEDTKPQQVTIPLTTKLNKGAALLEIAFSGILNDNMKGFYRSNKIQARIWRGCLLRMHSVLFEACDARLAFPCWDEPSAKATFTVEMEYPSDLICLSNMPPVKESQNGKLKTVLFDKSPKMSTYLLAWVIGEFEYIEAKTSRDVVMRIYTSIGKKDQAKYALKIAVKCLDFYEKYFGINYPLPKQDMIALADFAAGAMENWGLITYREVRLLCDEATVSLRVKQGIARVICHELAHQWFGNLVTMDWWSQLWLNEGFASFMQYMATEVVDPSLDIWNLYMVREFPIAFKLDGMLSSHPIEVPVLTAKGADEVFDAISYCKGSCVIVMLQSYLGDEVFQKGLVNYLKKFAYSNAITTDLWQYLSEASGKDVAAIMQNWTRCQGFPVIEATITDKAAGKLMLKQSRYLSSGRPSKELDNVVWNVPIVMKIDGKEIPILLDEREKEFEIEAIKTSKYVHLNANSKGFYAVQYSAKMLSDLFANTSQLKVTEKLMLIRELTAISKSGYAEDATENLLDFIVASKEEKSSTVWVELMTAASDINTLIDNDKEMQPKYNQIMVDVLTPIYEALNKWGDEDTEDQKKDMERSDIFRPMVLQSMAKYGNKEVIDVCTAKFNSFVVEKKQDDEKSNISDALKSFVYSTAMKNGDKSTYEALKEHYLTTEDNMEKRRALTCLGATKDPELIKKTLYWAKDSDEVRKQDKTFALSWCRVTPAGRELCWNFIKETIGEWKALYGGGGFLLNALFKLPSGFVDAKKADEVEKFYATLVDDYDACQKSMKQCVETIRLTASWREGAIKSIEKWINKQSAK